jgi:ribonuclease BN (tRNA processing enzyme)
MKLIFIGSGSAFTVGSDNYHSNMLLKSPDGQHLLIDCGSDARLALYDLGLNHRDIQSVYISHLHADHVGGLEWLAFTTKFDASCVRPYLYINESLVEPLWKTVLSGGLNSLQGEIATLNTYFIVHPVLNNATFRWQNLDIHMLQTVHILAGYSIMPSYGLLFTVDGLNVFITTDTQFAPHQVEDFYKKADVIFHDCETCAHKSGVHAHYVELMTLPPELKKKMWLYHYNPGDLPDAVKDGFRGFVKKGQIFDFEDDSTY